MNCTRATQLEGLEESVLPILPIVKTVQIKVPVAYAFTDYRSQGQIIPYVMVDLASPPSGKLSLFNLYVALSQSSGRQTI